MDEEKWPEFVKKTELYMKNKNSQNKNETAESKSTKKPDTTEKLNVQLPIIRKNSTGSAVSHVTGNAAGKSGRNLWNTDRNFTESISEKCKDHSRWNLRSRNLEESG